MIVKNELEQWVGCTGCGERIELRRKTLSDPETVLLLMERLREDHVDCDRLSLESPRKAEVARDFRRRMRREFAKHSNRQIVACGAHA